MKRPDDKVRSLPQHDYALALQTAVSWLGDRYLLAEPVTRRPDPAPYYNEPRRWHEASRAAARRH